VELFLKFCTGQSVDLTVD